jgi:hypothetical protein
MRDTDSVFSLGIEENKDAKEVPVDLSDMESLRSSRNVEARDAELSFMKERNAGEIAQMTIRIVAGLVLLLPMIGGGIAAFRSVEQAEAYTRIVTALLESVGRFVMMVFWPMLAYYFIRGRVNKSGS